MIPFNRLGFLFKMFGIMIYPGEARVRLSTIGRSLAPRARVLDLGGGTGVLADLIHRVRQDLRCVAADPALGMLEKGSPHILKAAGLAESLPFKENIFEAVLIGDALHHFDNPLKAILEVMRVLKPDGILFIFDMDPETFAGRIIYRVEKLMREPARFRPPEELSKILTDYGFRVKTERYDWRYSITAEL